MHYPGIENCALQPFNRPYSHKLLTINNYVKSCPKEARPWALKMHYMYTCTVHGRVLEVHALLKMGSYSRTTMCQYRDNCLIY